MRSRDNFRHQTRQDGNQERSRDKLKKLNLLFYKTYAHQTCQGGDLGEAPSLTSSYQPLNAQLWEAM